VNYPSVQVTLLIVVPLLNALQINYSIHFHTLQVDIDEFRGFSMFFFLITLRLCQSKENQEAMKIETDGFEKLVIEVIKVINKTPLCSSGKECTGGSHN
jgi:hypothetical protein